MKPIIKLDYGFAKELAEVMRRYGLMASARPRKSAGAVATISFRCTHHDDHHPSAYLSVTDRYVKIHCSVCTANKTDAERAEIERSIFDRLPAEVQAMMADYVLFSDTHVSNGIHQAFVAPEPVETTWQKEWRLGDVIETEQVFKIDDTYYEDSLDYLSERLRLRKEYIQNRLEELKTARGESIVSCEKYALRFNFDSKACIKYRSASFQQKEFRFFIDKTKASEKDYLLWPSPLSLKSFAERNNDGTYTLQTIFITEGELDALLLLLLGFPAVSITTGANSNEKGLLEALKHYISVLSINNIVLLFDEDEAGRSASKKIERMLMKELNITTLNLTAQAIFGGQTMYKYIHTALAEIYEVQAKTKDVNDYFATLVRNLNTYTKKFIGEALFTLDKVYYSLTKRTEDVRNFVHIAKPAKKHRQTEWIIENLLAKGEYMLVSGHAKVGKSLLSMFIANRLVHSLDLFGNKVCGRFRVAYLDAENSEAVKARRMYKNDLQDAASFNFVYNAGGLGIFNLRDDNQVSELLSVLIKEDIDVLIIDTLSSLISGEDDNSKKYADIILNFVSKCKRLGITVIAITHNNKYAEQDSVIAVKGTTNIAAQADTIFLCRKVKATDGFHYLLIDRTGRHEEEAAAHKFLVRFSEGKAVAYMDDELGIKSEIDRLTDGKVSASEANMERKVAEAVLACLKSKTDYDALIKEIKSWLRMNVKKHTEYYRLIENVLDFLKMEGFISEETIRGKVYLELSGNIDLDELFPVKAGEYKAIEYKLTDEIDSDADLHDKYMERYKEIEAFLLTDRGGEDDGQGDGGGSGGDEGGGEGGDDGTGGDDGGDDDGGGGNGGQDGGNEGGGETGLVFADWIEMLEWLKRRRQEGLFSQAAESGILAHINGVAVDYVKASEASLDEIKEALCENTVGFDIETAGDKIVLAAFTALDTKKKVFVVYNDDERRFAEILRDVITLSSRIVGHNLHFDLKHAFTLLERYNMQVENLDIVRIFDTMIAEKFLDRKLIVKFENNKLVEDEGSYALKDLLAKYFGVEVEKSYQKDFGGIIEDAHVLYNAADAIAVLMIAAEQLRYFDAEWKVKNIQKLFASVVYMAFASARGFMFDAKAFYEHKAQVESEVSEKMQALNKAFEADARKEEVYKLYLQKHKKLAAADKRWRNSDFVKAFFKVFTGEEIPDASFDTTKLYRNLDAVADAYLAFAEADSRTKQLTTLEKHISGGRLRGDFVSFGAITGRMRSKEPNLQNINKQNRRFFVADDGYCLLLYDFSNIEMRLAASIYEDETLRRIFSENGDAHKLLASRIYGKPEAEITKDERQLAKMVNFASLYGTTARTLRSILLAANPEWKDKISLEDAQKFLDAFFDTYKGLAKSHQIVKSYVNRHLAAKREFVMYVRNLHEVSYKVDESVKLDEYRLRRLHNQALNVLIQGAAAAGLYETLRRFHAKLYEAGLKTADAHVLACVHDEIVVQVRKELAEKVAEMLIQSAKEAFEADVDVRKNKVLLEDVPMAGELRISKNFRGSEEDKV